MTYIDFSLTPVADFLRLLNDEYKRNIPKGNLVYTVDDLSWDRPKPVVAPTGELANTTITLTVTPGSDKAKGDPVVRMYFRPDINEHFGTVPFFNMNGGTEANATAWSLAILLAELNFRLTQDVKKTYIVASDCGPVTQNNNPTEGWCDYSFELIDHLTLSGTVVIRATYAPVTV